MRYMYLERRTKRILKTIFFVLKFILLFSAGYGYQILFKNVLINKGLLVQIVSGAVVLVLLIAFLIFEEYLSDKLFS